MWNSTCPSEVPSQGIKKAGRHATTPPPPPPRNTWEWGRQGRETHLRFFGTNAMEKYGGMGPRFPWKVSSRSCQGITTVTGSLKVGDLPGPFGEGFLSRGEFLCLVQSNHSSYSPAKGVRFPSSLDQRSRKLRSRSLPFPFTNAQVRIHPVTRGHRRAQVAWPHSAHAQHRLGGCPLCGC